MPLCSIITAACSRYAEFTPECWHSVATQRDLGAWELEWCIQEDGAEPQLRDWLPVDERIRYGAAGAHHGIATTRNLALGRARGDLVRVLDHDDVLLPRALRDQTQAFEQHLDAAWVAGRAVDLLPDGSTEMVDVELPYGVIDPGQVARSWAATGVFPIHTAGVAIRTPIARAFGGWAALPRSEDLSLLVAVSEVFQGVHLSSASFLYRQWPGQTTRTDGFAQARDAAWRSVRQRAEAARCLFATDGRIGGAARR